MKVKCQPEDFFVEELGALVPCQSGPFALYRLTKTGRSTLEIIERIQQIWQLPRRRISWGGMKDKHATTRQWLTIHHGPHRSLTQRGFDLEYLGQADQAFGPRQIRGNRFEIIVRDLGHEEISDAAHACETIRREGLPNYFDDQRFGSMSRGGEFVAQPWLRGDYEQAIRLALAEPNPHDRTREKKDKAILRNHWGDWAACKRLLSRSHRRSIVTFLDDRPGDFRGAFIRMRKDLRSLFLSAFQSVLWNEILARLIEEICPEPCRFLVSLKPADVPFYRDLADEDLTRLQQVSLPLPCARTRLESLNDPLVCMLIDTVLERHGLAWKDLRVRHGRDVFFSKSFRPAVISVDNLQASGQADARHEGRHALHLSFALPRGSYATILLKRLFPRHHACHAGSSKES